MNAFFVYFTAALVKLVTYKIKEHVTINSFKILISNFFFSSGNYEPLVNIVRRSRKRILLMELGVIAIETFCSQ